MRPSRALRTLAGIAGGLALGLVGALLALKISAGRLTDCEPEQLRADLELLFRIIETVHPAPYAAVSAEELAGHRRAVEAQLGESLSVVEFYRLLAPLVAALGDGHSAIVPPGGAYQAAAWMGADLFPLELDFQGERVLVRDAPGEAALPAGSELVRLNGAPVGEGLGTALTLISGERQAWRQARLADQLPMYWWLAHGDLGLLRVVARTPGGELVRRELEGVHVLSTLGKGGRASTARELELLEQGGALLTVASFADDGGFEDFARQSFQRIRAAGASWLIIDLRQNMGGSSALGDELLQYLTDEPFRQYSRIQLKVSPQIRPRYAGSIPEDARDGDLADFDIPLIQPRDEPLRFQGELHVLIGPRVFSSAVAFASAVKDLELGTLVGEETGGAASCAGDLFNFRLPNSGLHGACSHKWFWRPSGVSDGRGVRPDIEVPAERALEVAVEEARAAARR